MLFNVNICIQVFFKTIIIRKMNLGRIKDFNRYMFILQSRRVPRPPELNPSTSLLSEQLVRPLRQSPPNMQHINITKAIYFNSNGIVKITA